MASVEMSQCSKLSAFMVGRWLEMWKMTLSVMFLQLERFKLVREGIFSTRYITPSSSMLWQRDRLTSLSLRSWFATWISDRVVSS